MSREYRYTARDKKAGMTFPELEDAVKEVSQYDEQGYRYRLKATVGFKGQLQSVTFVEVENEVHSPN